MRASSPASRRSPRGRSGARGPRGGRRGGRRREAAAIVGGARGGRCGAARGRDWSLSTSAPAPACSRRGRGAPGGPRAGRRGGRRRGRRAHRGRARGGRCRMARGWDPRVWTSWRGWRRSARGRRGPGGRAARSVGVVGSRNLGAGLAASRASSRDARRSVHGGGSPRSGGRPARGLRGPGEVGGAGRSKIVPSGPFVARARDARVDARRGAPDIEGGPGAWGGGDRGGRGGRWRGGGAR